MVTGLGNLIQRENQVSGTGVWWISGWDLWLASVLLCFGSALGHPCHLCIRQHGRKLSRRKLVISFYMSMCQKAKSLAHLANDTAVDALTHSQVHVSLYILILASYSHMCLDACIGLCACARSHSWSPTPLVWPTPLTSTTSSNCSSLSSNNIYSY